MRNIPVWGWGQHPSDCRGQAAPSCSLQRQRRSHSLEGKMEHGPVPPLSPQLEPHKKGPLPCSWPCRQYCTSWSALSSHPEGSALIPSPLALVMVGFRRGSSLPPLLHSHPPRPFLSGHCLFCPFAFKHLPIPAPPHPTSHSSSYF